jgi:hypothetical protein
VIAGVREGFTRRRQDRLAPVGGAHPRARRDLLCLCDGTHGTN